MKYIVLVLILFSTVVSAKQKEYIKCINYEEKYVETYKKSIIKNVSITNRATIIVLKNGLIMLYKPHVKCEIIN
ncbi:Uncharacterised protein [Escherichia coli]|uniref:Uncharacterized protein n=1 Tax=Escherichia phage vB_Eco_slurp01 TaxID=1874688 RepID=A0A1C3S6H2_9CAUD|nr:hypothetical protein vBEcoMphAPEC6_gp040c [Escherichia phage vB_EcoM_phAPEC6]SCA80080.1 hypothetical protein PSLUR01_00103 [Escherichia phage vB_Eco_slurp01]VVZ31427.1 Uncharacterised protein [Escherichia coli]VWN20897.1 Uncharacterised protein [Escherichia coli]